MFPDFLGIGASRTGTSWLYYNLIGHPRIWMPYIKELHYFDRAADYPSPSRLAYNNIFYRIFNCRPPGREWRACFKEQLLIEKKRFRPRRAIWKARYLFGICSDKWYASLFEEGRGRVTGEITPAYGILKPDDIRRIRSIMPGVKIIFIMRNPIERAWSHVKFNLGRDRGSLAQVPGDIFIERFNCESVVSISDYLRTMKNWLAHFPRKQFYIGFFDELVSMPESFLSKIFGFLGVDKGYRAKKIDRKINDSAPLPLPPRIEKYLAGLYYPLIKELSREFGSYPLLWLKEAEKILNRST